MMYSRGPRPRGTDEARVIQVIQTKALLGSGTEEDPTRYLFQYWDLDGRLLASCDEWKEQKEKEEQKSTLQKSV